HTAWITAGGPGIAPAPLMLGHHEFTPSRRNRARGGGPVIPARAPGPGGLAQHGRDLPHATSAAPGIRKMTVFPSGCQCSGCRGQVAVQGSLGDAGLGRDLAEAVTAVPEQPRVLDLVCRVGEGPPELPSGGFGDGAAWAARSAV